MRILITGAAGFIGYHLAQRLSQGPDTVTGLDNLNDYYDVALKNARLHLLGKLANFRFIKADIADKEAIATLFAEVRPDVVINLAAQAGVRYSLENPHAYIDSNITGFLNILEGCRHNKVKHLLFASSSSVYGNNSQMPFSVNHNVDHPVSLYAATKKSNELMAHAYANLYNIPCTGVRFFTVYGPWGRPDMAYYSFSKAIIEGRPIQVFNNGKMLRDFTYIDDIVEGLARLLEKIPERDPGWSSEQPTPGTSYAPYKIYNIGNNTPVELLVFIQVLEECLGRKAVKEFLPSQPGDVEATYADIDDLTEDTGFKPTTSIEDGLRGFTTWFQNYYRA